MKLLQLKNNSNSRYIVMGLRFLLLLTCIFKGWLTAQMQYNILGGAMGVSMQVILYLANGLLPFVFFWLLTSMMYNSMFRSKYTPRDMASNMLFTKYGFCGTFYIIGSVFNIVTGALGFVSFAVRSSITLLVLLLPVLATLATLVTMFVVLLLHVGKSNFKGLFVSMTWLSVLFLLFVR